MKGEPKVKVRVRRVNAADVREQLIKNLERMEKSIEDQKKEDRAAWARNRWLIWD